MPRQSMLAAEETAIQARVLSLGELQLLKERRERRHVAKLPERAYDEGEMLPKREERALESTAQRENVLKVLGVAEDAPEAEVLYQAVLCGDLAGACLQAGVSWALVEEWRGDGEFQRRERLAVGDLHKGYLRLALSASARDGATRRDVAPLLHMAQAVMPEQFRGRPGVEKKPKGRLAAAMEGNGV